MKLELDTNDVKAILEALTVTIKQRMNTLIDNGYFDSGDNIDDETYASELAKCDVLTNIKMRLKEAFEKTEMREWANGTADLLIDHINLNS